MATNRRPGSSDIDRIATNTQELDELISRSNNNNLLENGFHAIILTGYNTLPGAATRTGDFNWFRIRALDGSDDARCNPFRAKSIRKSEVMKLIQRHRPAYWSKKNNIAGSKPKSGEIWWCRYLKKRYQQPIALIHKTGDSGLVPHVIEDDEHPGDYLSGQYYLGYNVKGPTDIPAFAFRSYLTWDETKQLAAGMPNFLNTLGRLINSAAIEEYELFNCGYPELGVDSCNFDVLNKYSTRFLINKPQKAVNIVEAVMPEGINVGGESITGMTAHFVKDLYSAMDFKGGGANSGQKGSKLGCIGYYLYSKVALKSRCFGDAAKQTSGKWPSTYLQRSPPEEPKGPLVMPDMQSTKFDKEFQDAISAWTILQGYPMVGGYLIGKYDDPKWAAHELSKEWSQLPAQFNIPSVEIYYAGSPLNIDIIAGEGYYQDIRNKKPKLKIGSKYDNFTDPLKTFKMMEEGKKEFQAFLEKNPAMVDIVRRKDDKI